MSAFVRPVPGEARVLAATRDRVGESPVWDAEAQCLYWVDIEGRRIHRWDWATQRQQSWETPQRTGCIALSARGGLVAAMEDGVYAVELQDGMRLCQRLLARVTHPRDNMRFNDGRCDSAGRLWASTMCMDMSLAAPVGAWYCLDERGLVGPVYSGLVTPNGSAFSPDGRTLYFSDSHPSVQKVWAFDYDPAEGSFGRGREFLDMTPLPGRPDGAAMDVEGHYWICGNDAGQVHRVSPAGASVASIQPAGVEAGLSGAVFVLAPGVCGLPEPRFSRFPAALPLT